MKTSVGVIFGCVSVEHEVSIISGVQAINNLDKEKYDIVPIYVTKSGQMLFDKSFCDINTFRNCDLSDFKNKYMNVYIGKNEDRFCLYNVKGGFKKNKLVEYIDVVLPVVHGTNCEDGTVSGYLQMLGIPYVGCNTMSAALGMDKDLFKKVLISADIPTLPHIAFTSMDWSNEKELIIKDIEKKFGYPVIVKPANLGSSIGISKASDLQSLIEAIDLATSFASKVIIERAITNLREINCSVLGDQNENIASVCEEPVMQDEILSFTDKYISNQKSSEGMATLKRKLPADISDEKMKEIQKISCDTFKTIGANGVVRIDYLMDCDDNEKVYVNEINTIPGSLAFYLWEATGIKYNELLDRLISLAFKRKREEENLVFTYDSNILDGVGSFGAKGSKGSKF